MQQPTTKLKGLFDKRNRYNVPYPQIVKYVSVMTMIDESDLLLQFWCKQNITYLQSDILAYTNDEGKICLAFKSEDIVESIIAEIYPLRTAKGRQREADRKAFLEKARAV